jgi:hypothetical protein
MKGVFWNGDLPARFAQTPAALCKNSVMPNQNDSEPQHVQAAYYPVIINFSDDSSEWYKHIATAIHAGPPEIRVQFYGGCEVAPFDLICLRNCLLDVPESIRLVTVAMGSLPAFACVPWLAGEERHIAGEARVWIPDLPEPLLRHGTKARHSKPIQFVPTAAEAAEAEAEAEVDEIFGVTAPSETSPKTQRRSAHLRRETDLRILADITNEWFPSWEFAGKSLRFHDLLEWGVVKPEWVIGSTRSGVRRTTAVPVEEATPAKKTPQANRSAQGAAKKRGKSERHGS